MILLIDCAVSCNLFQLVDLGFDNFDFPISPHWPHRYIWTGRPTIPPAFSWFARTFILERVISTEHDRVIYQNTISALNLLFFRLISLPFEFIFQNLHPTQLKTLDTHLLFLMENCLIRFWFPSLHIFENWIFLHLFRLLKWHDILSHFPL